MNLRIGLIGLGKLGLEIAENTEIEKIFSKRIIPEFAHKTTQNFDEFLEAVDCIIYATTHDISEFIEKPIVFASTIELKKMPQHIIFMPNGSISWNIVYKTVISFAETGKYDFIITETHHKNKKDAPSGTARALIKELQQYTENITVTSIRSDDFAGIHSITAFNQNEYIKIDHCALKRKIFVEGLIKAANWLVEQPKGVYFPKDLF